MPQSAFFSKWSGGATTCGAQSVISTCYSTFEAFIMDNFLFYDINECFHWLNCVNEQIEKDIKSVEWLKPHTLDEVFEKLKGMFVEWKDSYEEPLYRYLSNLGKNKLNRIYYRNRLMEFTDDHPEVLNLHRRIVDNITVLPIIPEKVVKKKDPNWESYIPKNMIGKFDSADAYNSFASKEAFMDPNNIPDSVSNDVKELSSYYMKYVYTPYLVFDRIYRLKNFTRKTVVIVDTDSNILALDNWLHYIMSKLPSNTGKDRENLEFIIINTITYTLTEVVTDVLLFYGENSNIPEEFRPKFNMKNEFLKIALRTLNLFNCWELSYINILFT